MLIESRIRHPERHPRPCRASATPSAGAEGDHGGGSAGGLGLLFFGAAAFELGVDEVGDVAAEDGFVP